MISDEAISSAIGMLGALPNAPANISGTSKLWRLVFDNPDHFDQDFSEAVGVVAKHSKFFPAPAAVFEALCVIHNRNTHQRMLYEGPDGRQTLVCVRNGITPEQWAVLAQRERNARGLPEPEQKALPTRERPNRVIADVIAAKKMPKKDDKKPYDDRTKIKSIRLQARQMKRNKENS